MDPDPQSACTVHCKSKFRIYGAVLRIRDVYPGSRISDPGSKNSNKREGWKKFFCHNFLCSQKFHKIANYFSFEVLKKKIWANFQRIIEPELFTQKFFNKLSKNMGLGSGIRKKPIPDAGSRGQKGTGSRIRIRNTAMEDQIRAVKSHGRSHQSSVGSNGSLEGL